MTAFYHFQTQLFKLKVIQFYIAIFTYIFSGAPNVNFWKISVWKTIEI